MAAIWGSQPEAVLPICIVLPSSPPHASQSPQDGAVGSGSALGSLIHFLS